MQAPENAVWQAFRIANVSTLRTLYFNVHCGTVAGLTATMPENERRERTALWAKRVDVIAETSDDVWVIECKAAVRPSAVGQLLTYLPLIPGRKAYWQDARPLLIAATFDPDALALCASFGIECLAPPFRALAPRRRA